MILESLANFHETLVAEHVLPPVGFERRQLRYVVTLSEDGRCLEIKDHYERKGSAQADAWFNVPVAVRRTSQIQANLLWDNLEYAFGVSSQNDGEVGDGVLRRHRTFITRLKDFAELAPDDAGIRAILQFYQNGEQVDYVRTVLGKADGSAIRGTVSFRLVSDLILVVERKGLRNAIVDAYKEPSFKGQCLVKGQAGALARTHGLIRGLRGGHSVGTSLVTSSLAAGRSYGLMRGQDAPVSQSVAAAYVCALNWLLEPANQHALTLDRLTVLFWEEHAGADDVTRATHRDGNDLPDPDSVTRIDDILTSIRTGTRAAVGSTQIYALGLTANNSRASVVFWRRAAASQLAKNIDGWIADLTLAPDKVGVTPLLTISNLVRDLNIAKERRDHQEDPITFNLISAAAFREPVWPGLLAVALRALRTQANPQTLYSLIAMIKMTLIRSQTIQIPPELDKGIADMPYRLGRLFGVLERLQALAYPRTSASIRERFWASSSATPLIGFRTPLRMARIYISKLDRQGKAYFEKVLEEVTSGLPAAGLPARLTLHEQGVFAVGYYHQRAALSGWRTQTARGRK